MHWRRSQPALGLGDIHFIDTAEPLLAFTRRLDGEALLAVFNLSAGAADFLLPPDLREAVAVGGHGLSEGQREQDQVHLPAYGVWFARSGAAD